MNYYDMLNESFKKMLLEARQDEINFANVFGAELKDRFKAQKQRMQSPQNDFYYWIRMSREEGLDDAIANLESTLRELENRPTRSQRRSRAAEGATIVFEDDNWIVLRIDTYEAAKRYGAGSVWCITGRYHGHEEEGEHWFEHYKEQYGWDYYFYIKKDGRDFEGRQEKWCLCWNSDPDNMSDYQIWRGDQRERDEEEVDYIPDAPHIEGMPAVWEPREEDYDEYDDDEDVELDDEGEPVERPAPAPREPEFEMIDIEDPNALEFPARSKEEAVAAFKAGADIVDSINDTMHIAHWREGDEDRYCLFVFFPGQGGGPLLAQTNNGFGLQAFKNLDAVRQLARSIGIDGIRNNANDIDAEGMPECLKENFWYYDDGSWYYDV